MNSVLSAEEFLVLLVNRFHEERQTRNSANPHSKSHNSVVATLKDFVEVFSEGRLQVVIKPESHLQLDD